MIFEVQLRSRGREIFVEGEGEGYVCISNKVMDNENRFHRHLCCHLWLQSQTDLMLHAPLNRKQLLQLRLELIYTRNCKGLVKIGWLFKRHILKTSSKCE